MSLAAFTFTDRVRPIVEFGIGDARESTGNARWDVARWDASGSTWSGVEPSWLDVTCDVRAVRLEYGRKRTTDRFVVGQATIDVDNASGWADPNTVDDPGVLSVRPGRQMRVSIEHVELGRRVLFRGFVDAMTPSYLPTVSDSVAFSVIDALGEVNRAKFLPLLNPVGDGETIDARIGRILDACQWPAELRELDPSGDALLGTDFSAQAADLLGQAADSGGGSVFGNYDGRVVFRSRDWQSYLPDSPPDGTIGNVGTGYWIPAVPGYLTPTVGTVTTPTAGALPNDCVWVMKIRGPSNTSGAPGIAGYGADAEQSWAVRRTAPTQGDFPVSLSSDGAGLVITRAVDAGAVTGADEWLALAYSMSGGNWSLGTYRSTNGVAWTTVTPMEVVAAALSVFTPTTPMRIGSAAGGVFTGRIYSVELRTGLDPAAGTVIWRFDASDYPGTGTSYVDPRGRTWTLTDAAAITPTVPPVFVPADVCPVSWDRPFARQDIATRAIVGRDPFDAFQYDDTDGIMRFGIEPFERTDLLTQDDRVLDRLGARILATRSALTAPRVRSVTLDARTSDEALDLMSSVDVYLPSRYRCRLELDRGLVFDEEYLATGVIHTIEPRLWTLELNLDSAAPFAVAGGRWDGAYWDRSTWSAVA